MIDYADAILKLKIGERQLHDLLLRRKLDKNTLDIADDCIVAIIQIKQWIKEQSDYHK